MDIDFKFFVDEEGKNICTIEDKNVTVQIVLKKDYSNIEEKLRELHIIQDIENALGAATENISTVTETKEFKDLVDSYGYLYVDNLND